MNVETSRGCLTSDQFIEQQRPLAKINSVRQPIVGRDGRIELLPEGYDVESNIHTAAGGVVIDESWDLDKARTFLVDFHKEFPFTGRRAEGMSRGLAIHISSMLALFATGLQEPTEARLNFSAKFGDRTFGIGEGRMVNSVAVARIGSGAMWFKLSCRLVRPYPLRRCMA